MRLNFDVLFLVMAAMRRRSDILTCMLTCRTMHEIGQQYLLRMPLHLPINDSIEPLCEYILRQFPERSRYLRELTLGTKGDGRRTYVGVSVINLLAKVLSEAQDLRTMTIHNINQLFLLENGLSDALSGLKGITELNLLWPSFPVFQAIEKMESPVKRLNVDFYAYNRQLVNPLPRIANFRSNLEEVSLSFVKFPPTFDLEKDSVFPKVLKLYIKHSPLTPLDPLVRSFPNVRSLTIFMFHHPDILSDKETNQRRESNRTTQLRQSWSDLHHFEGDLLSLYILGLRDMIVHDVSIMNVTTPVLQFIPILVDIRPSRLSLSITTRECKMATFSQYFGRALRELQLTHLFVTLDLSYSYPDVEDILVSSPSLIK